MSGPTVDLVLQPDAARSGSMVLYAERLAAAAPEPGRWRVQRLAGLPTPAGRWAAELALAPWALRRLDGDVAHVVDQGHAGYVRALRGPTVVTVHDLIPLKHLAGEYGPAAGGAMSRRAALWYRRNIAALDRAGRLVAPSRATADDLKRLLSLDAVVVPHGIDAVYFETPGPAAEDQVLRRLGGADARPLIVSVSSGHFYKNDTATAVAFARLAARRKDLALVRVGAPWRGDAAAALAGVAPGRVLAVGKLAVSELAALYRLARALVFPSWDEGFGWPPLEAMAAGLPVVASDRGALAETAAPAAEVVDPANPEAIAAALERVIDDPGLAAELRARGAEHAARYRWRDAAAAMAAIYDEAARCA